MEKFSNWRDKGTGISPFVPIPEPSTPLYSRIISPLISLIKLPILLSLFLLSFIWTSPSLIKIIIKFLFSFSKIDFSVQGIKRSNLIKINQSKPSLNQIIFVNYITPIDSLFLATISNVSSWRKLAFVIPDSKGDTYVYSMWGFIKHSFQFPHSITSGKKITLDKLLKQNLVVFYFIEGTPSNNRSILPLQKNISIPTSVSAKLLILKIYPPFLTLPVPTVSLTKYIFTLLTGLHNRSIKFRLVDIDSGSNLDNSIKLGFTENGWNIIDDSLNIDNKINFYNYFIDYKVKRE